MNELITRINAAVAAAAFIIAPLGVGVSTVSATSNAFELSVPINTVKRGSVGSVHELANKNIEQKYQGMVCTVDATAENQHSVHPGNNLIVTSGNGSVTLKDVERQGGVHTVANGDITLGSKVTVSLVIGQDKVFSGGMDVNITCADPEIEVCRDGEVVTIRKSERRNSDTNVPCPIPEIEVCRDGKVVTIKETDRKDSDTATPCPTPEFNANIVCSVVDDKAVFKLNIKQTNDVKNVSFSPENGTIVTGDNDITVVGTYNDGTADKTVKAVAKAATDCTPEKKIEVCRDSKVVTILESEKKTTDTSAPCEIKGVTTELPNTGAGSIAGLIGGAAFAGGTAIAQLRMRRNAAKRS